MKIAITGHTSGIGLALANAYSSQGHTIVGLTQSTHPQIRDIPLAIQLIESCDMFINNGHSLFTQTDLLYKVWRRWEGQKKHIIVIGSQVVTLAVPKLAQENVFKIPHYIQKLALDEMVKQLRSIGMFPMITVVNPGAVLTPTTTNMPMMKADSEVWAKNLLKCLDVDDSLHVYEITLGVNDMIKPV